MRLPFEFMSPAIEIFGTMKPETKDLVRLTSIHRVMPEFVTLPSRGGDAICGLSRSFWYACEKDGLIKLRRIRRPGNVRGRVLLPVAEAIGLIDTRST